MGKILEINGPLVKLLLPEAVIGEQVRVGQIGLVGEVISRDGNTALAQLYEDTGGLRPGEVADGLGWPLSVELGPGLLNAIFDGVQRPLNAVRDKSGDRIARGVSVPSLPRDRRWHFTPDPQRLSASHINGGDVLGTVRETESILHRILASPKTHGELLELAPEAIVVGSGSAIRYLEDMLNAPFNSLVVKDGDTLDLGNKKLKFISAPNLHWPDSIYTWLEEDKILFTCDSFGAHYCSYEMKDEINDDYLAALATPSDSLDDRIETLVKGLNLLL